jgi:hypothetical protein
MDPLPDAGEARGSTACPPDRNIGRTRWEDVGAA